MGTRVEAFAATIPAQTPVSAPVTRPLAFPAGYLAHIDVIIPDGVSGLAGFQIAYAGQQLIPETPGAWIVGNDEKFSADPDYAMVGQQWQLVGYNTDVNDHTFYCRCYVREIGDAGAGAPIGGQTLPVAITPDTFAGGDTLDITPALPDDTTVPTDVPVPALSSDVPALDTTLGDAPAPDDTTDVAPAPELDTTLGDAPAPDDAP